MRVFSSLRALLCVAGLLVFSLSASAAGVAPKELMGKWKEQGNNGVMQWELAPDKISVVALDTSGQPLGDPTDIDVLFEPIDVGWAVVILAHDGSSLGDGEAKLVNGALMIVLPAIGTHELKRADSNSNEPAVSGKKSKKKQ